MVRLRVAVIGCGNVSGGHIRAWSQETERAEIVAFVDRAAEFAQQRRTEAGATTATVHTDMREVLARSDVDAVDICTPSHLHAEQIASALDAGKHVVTEKPTGYTLEECRRLRWYALRYPHLKVAVAYSLRYYPLNLRVRELIQSGTLGRVLFVEGAHNHPHDFSHDAEDRAPVLTRWLEDKGGRYIPGSELNGPTHVFDLMRYLGGEVRDVFAFREASGTFALMRFRSGAVGKATGATASNQGIATPHVLCIQGTAGTIFTQNECQYTEKGMVQGYRGYLVTGGKTQPIDVAGQDNSHGDATRTRNFLDAVQDGAPLICGLEDGIRSSELLHALWDSQTLEIRVPVHQAGKTG